MDEGEQQEQFRCQHCGSRSECIYDKEPSKFTFILSFFSLIIFGFYSILLIPLIIQATRSIVKKCYDCNEVIESHDLFSLPSFNDKVLNFRFGNCALILSRKYAYGILLFFIIIYVFVGGSDPEQDTLAENSNISYRTWEQYVQDCGKDIYISNGVKAKANFLKYYDNKIIQWEGVFIQHKNSDTIINQQSAVYIKMIPTDTIDGVQDIILILNKNQLSQYKSIIEQLSPGDIIKFEGKFTHMGDELSYHAIDVQSLSKTERKKKISEIPTVTEYQHQLEQEQQATV